MRASSTTIESPSPEPGFDSSRRCPRDSAASRPSAGRPGPSSSKRMARNGAPADVLAGRRRRARARSPICRHCRRDCRSSPRDPASRRGSAAPAAPRSAMSRPPLLVHLAHDAGEAGDHRLDGRHRADDVRLRRHAGAVQMMLDLVAHDADLLAHLGGERRRRRRASRSAARRAASSAHARGCRHACAPARRSRDWNRSAR